MTEEKKQELRHLLQETMKRLQIRYEYGFLPIPIEIYRRYLQKRWSLFGVDYLSFTFSTRFIIFIEEDSGELKPFYQIDKNSKIHNFIKEELTPFIRKGSIPEISTGSYIVECGFDDGSRIFCPRGGISQLHHILDHLLHIALVRGIDEAVLAFDRSCYPEGVHSFFYDVYLIDGIRLETKIEIYKGVKLISLPSLQTKKIEEEVLRYLPGFPNNSFVDNADSFYGKTLLIIDCPGFSIFHLPPKKLFEQGTKTADLPFQVKEPEVKLRNRKEINVFLTSFFNALSLVCNSTVYIHNLGWFLAEDKSVQGHSGTIRTSDPFWERRPFVGATEVGQSEIEKAIRLYEILVDPNSDVAKKLQIPIDRWIKSKTNKSAVDKIIDLGIALESLYLSGIDSKTELRLRFSLHATWHLGKDKAHREELIKEFKTIYDWRSTVVHTGKLPEKGSGKKKKPYPSEEVKAFITNAQNRCRDSIIKILEDGKFPDWNNLMLGEESS